MTLFEKKFVGKKKNHRFGHVGVLLEKRVFVFFFVDFRPYYYSFCVVFFDIFSQFLIIFTLADRTYKKDTKNVDTMYPLKKVKTKCFFLLFLCFLFYR